METWSKVFLKFMTIILIGAFCVSCDPIKKSEVNIVESKNIIIEKFKSDAEYIFGKKILDEKIFSSYNSERLIFQVKDLEKNSDNFIDKIDGLLNKRGWNYKEKYKEAYIYCDRDMNQLELVPPIKIGTVMQSGEGQSLNQLVDYWNIGFIHSRHKRYVCNMNS
ncbi:hypothetical protein N1009_000270 [Acinetobacter baumannii]|uniref:hypothetical protein n=2 Tax=Acinetobacter baumannii TaxID=470 RepID=UPI0005805ABA|nr:hypothetical protein [Acinetobacter baumannii]EHU2111633.1 hypothetical protein [Acinetobacter baumannii]EHZ6775236.1 hypothetical protein [Acinetobacter baumannii]EKU1425809.1 hypothetical protein [Acinetobacter baumannii]EKU3487486.1 hypothetical protein [Acinetobacter baumannii]EKU6392690.1 hypothetical protein [Acinetobacter baumannii]